MLSFGVITTNQNPNISWLVPTFDKESNVDSILLLLLEKSFMSTSTLTDLQTPWSYGVLQYPSYTPDSSPCCFHVFGSLKEPAEVEFAVGLMSYIFLNSFTVWNAFLLNDPRIRTLLSLEK